jgi:ParB family protein of integrating conjugative element (PFGI_1 class)
MDATVLVIELGQIQPYERNPRHSRNREYDRIKDSIRNHGLDQPLTITQRPGVADYIVHTGGNTRLLVLKELFEETGDPRYSRIPCLYRPWRQESDVVLAHLRENDIRGGLTFVDKARAIFEVRKLLAEEGGFEAVSQRQLEVELRRAGYRISQALISQMEYAVCRLLPVIPLALEQGLGRPQVERIRRLERAAYTVWCERFPDDADQFEDIFVALCRRYDGPDWETDVLRGALESEIAEAAEISIHTAKVILEAELAGRKLVIPEFVAGPDDESSVTEGVGTCLSDAGATQNSDNPEGPIARPTQEDEVPQEVPRDVFETTDSVESPDHDLDDVDCGVTESAERIPELLSTKTGTGSGDLKSLRGRAWTLAARLAQRNGIGELIEPLSGNGLGFLLRDVPDPALAEQLDEDNLSRLSMLWWQLAACAEMTFAPLESILPLLPADAILRRALETEDADLLFGSIWTLDPGHTGYRLWRVLDERDWSDLLNLMDTYRCIRRVAEDTGVPVWV